MFNTFETSDDQHFYQRYAMTIFSYLRLHTSSREDAEDLLYDIFLQALEHREFMQLDEEKQRAWLLRVAHNKIIDRYRQAKRRQFVTLEFFHETLFDDENQAPEQVALRREAYAQLQVAVQRLPEPQQEILRLRFATGLRCTEIAALLGKREGTIRSILSRALSSLRTIYKEEVKV